MPSMVGQQLDHYKLVEQIGQGGMATVYRATDTRKLNEVAIKVLSPTLGSDKRFLRRFRREASVVSRLKHPGIVPVIDYGENRGYAYLVMPFVVGDTLYNRMTRKGVTQDEAGRWMDQVSAALQFAHDHSVIHRDIKPSNIMITPQSAAKLTDFGLARMTDTSTSLTGSMILGTPAYVSPEQGRGGEVSFQSDQYSLGVILYQLSTGRLPFESDSAMGTVLMHMQDPVPPPRQFNPKLPLTVERVILKSLAKAPQDRFATVAALNDSYQRALRGEEVPSIELAAPPPTTIAPAPVVAKAPAQRRWPAYILGGAAVVALAAIGLATFLPGQPAANDIPATSLPNPSAASPIPVVVEATLPNSSEGGTATPVTASFCPGLRMFGFRREGPSVAWSLDNGEPGAVRLIGFNPEFPADNPLQEVWLGEELLWQAPADGPYPESGEIPNDDRSRLEPGSVESLRLGYAWSDQLAGNYALELVFDSGCSLTTSW